ncbi:hypothetical protein [Nocardia sp. NPDC056000]|uniref:hypothetical protein n=1 Tax=Nocardia sp. NPDC056000 TaxID=3345674 RepID=UPI0035D90F9C
MALHRNESDPANIERVPTVGDLSSAEDLKDPERVKFLHQELAQANAKITASFAAALASATIGSALIAAALFNLPRPCSSGDTSGKCVPVDWNPVYAIMPLLSVLVAVIIMETTSRLIALGIYATDIERQVNRFQPVHIAAFDANKHAWVTRLIPSSEQMISGFVSENGRRFSIRPVNVILWTSCLTILVAAIVIPILLIESTPLQVVSAVFYAQLIYLIARFTVSYTSQPRMFAHELWSNALDAAGTSAARHTLNTDARHFIRFLIYPRPIGDHFVKLAISFSAILAAVLSSADGHSAIARGVLAWLFVEFVLYPIRYQINDIRDYQTDRRHPAWAARNRTPFTLTRNRERVVAILMLDRVVIGVAVGVLYGLTRVEWLWVAGFSAALALSTWLYEQLKKHFKSKPMPSLGERIPVAARALVVLCASGYSLRVGFVFVATVPSFTAPRWTLCVLLTAAIGVSEYFLLKNQWATEGTSFVEATVPARKADKRLLVKPHFVFVLRDSKILPRGGITALDTAELRECQLPRYQGRVAPDLGIAVEGSDTMREITAERFVPRLVHLARSRQPITLSHLMLVMSVAALAAGFWVIGPPFEGRRRLLIAGAFIASFVAIDQIHQFLQRHVMPAAAKQRQWQPLFGPQGPILLSLALCNALAFVALGVSETLFTELNRRQGLYVLIPALLCLMVLMGESGNYRVQRDAAKNLAKFVLRLRKSPERLRAKIFATPDEVATVPANP